MEHAVVATSASDSVRSCIVYVGRPWRFFLSRELRSLNSIRSELLSSRYAAVPFKYNDSLYSIHKGAITIRFMCKQEYLCASQYFHRVI